ncbi:MAG: glutamate racemase [Oscillospiraceae bacterium]
MDNRPIGVFDTGLGGLTTVSELKRIMPNENIIYFGDTSRVPYGTRSRETIQKYTKQDIRFLLSHDVKMVIVACNTASTVITPDMVKNLHVPFAQVITPAVNSAVAKTKGGKIGIIGTTATIRSGAYEVALLSLNQDLQITTSACPLFVPLVENGYTSRDNKVTRLIAEEYLAPLKAANVDTLILGCTHYPIIKDIIADIMGDDVILIDSGIEVAAVAYDILNKKSILNLTQKPGDCQYFVSDSAADFTSSASMIFGENKIDNATKIDIESY